MPSECHVIGMPPPECHPWEAVRVKPEASDLKRKLWMEDPPEGESRTQQWSAFLKFSNH